MKTSDSNTAMSDEQLIVQCEMRIYQGLLGFYTTDKELMAELLSRFQKAQNKWIRPDKLILDKADELYGHKPSLSEMLAFRQGCKWMFEYLTTNLPNVTK